MAEQDPLELAKTMADAPGSTERPELAATLADTAPHEEAAGELARGATVGRYIVLELAGAGGMGVVYRAYDPELDRKVALKLVRHRASEAGDTDGRARMLREAQAIARLSHPNVVAIHDVGTAGDVVFIAMELVEGDTLAAWLRAQPRRVSEILDVLVQAGRGLAAAHRSGLVHRDVKPDNILVGHDGRARVVDFGLVREAGGTATLDPIVEQHVRPSEPMLSTPLTQVGTVMGTPLYMAPEQLVDGTSDARTDQYSFCVALYEALAGELPFRGDDLATLRAKVLGGKAAPLPGRVPAHVAAAIRRGMSVEPAARWPAMDELLAELARDPAARRRRGLVAAGAVALLGLAIGIPMLARGGDPASPCEGGPAQFATAWGPEQRTALHAAFAATKVPYAEAAFDGVARHLDQYGAAWAKTYADSCQATHVRGEQSVELLDLRTACLASRRTEVGALVELMLDTDARAIERVHTAIAGLSPVSDCDDVAALQAPVKLPADPAARKAIADLRVELAHVQAQFHAGRFKDALPRIDALVPRAHALGFRPLDAEVGFVAAQVHNRTGDVDGAPALFVAALVAATASRDDELAVRISLGLAQAATNKQEFTRGHDLVALAGGLVERLGDAPLRRAAVDYTTGYLMTGEGKYPAAAEAYERARAVRERLAPNSQDLARTLNSLAHVYDEIGRYAEARAAGERGLALQQAELGPLHPENALVLSNLGNVAADEGDLARATAYYQRALAIREQTASEDPSLIANVLNNLGTIAQEQGRYDDALADHRRALALREKIDPAGPDVSMSLVNIGAAQCKQGDHDAALAGYRRALAIAEAKLGKDHPFVGDALAGVGECTFHRGDYEASQAALERALAIRKLGGRPIELAELELSLARTLWARGQHAPARAHATAARTAIATDAASAKRLAEIDAWLAAHH